jgi:hypothetical protein
MWLRSSPVVRGGGHYGAQESEQNVSSYVPTQYDPGLLRVWISYHCLATWGMQNVWKNSGNPNELATSGFGSATSHIGRGETFGFHENTEKLACRQIARPEKLARPGMSVVLPVFVFEKDIHDRSPLLLHQA